MIAETVVRTLFDQAWLLLILYSLACLAVALMVISYTAWSAPSD